MVTVMVISTFGHRLQSFFGVCDAANGHLCYRLAWQVAWLRGCSHFSAIASCQ